MHNNDDEYFFLLSDNFAREFHQGSRPGSSFSGAEPSPIVGVDPGYASDPYGPPYDYRDQYHGNLIYTNIFKSLDFVCIYV